MTREAWLIAAVDALRDGLFTDLGHTVPAIRVSVGWPHGGRKNTIGQCWPGATATDGVGHIFISPILNDRVAILGVLVHELIHAINHANGQNGHGKDFSAIAKPAGLTGKMTSTVAGEELTVTLTALAETLGDLDHGALVHMAANKGGSERSGRLIKVRCADDPEFVISMSKTRIAEYGTPYCPCHDERMEEV